MGLVTDKVALVTGAAAGIGRSTALLFAAEGAKVVVSDVDEKSGNETATMIKANGGEAVFVKADVSKAKDVAALLATALKTYGRIDCACNNAGIEGKIMPFHEQPESNFDAIMAVNAKGVFLCLKAEIEHMRKGGGGAIVNLSSVAGMIGFPGLSPYVASKHAVIGMTKNAALEYGKEGIRVNAICPGGIETRMLDSLADQASGGKLSTHDLMAPLHPIGRIGKPQEVAELIVWLCSDRAGFVTGAAVPVDGGYTAQ
ncbi:MAG: SDR family oxidoreductase [Hyphomicrobiales bacterium]|nr:SDR family oxidoreductase [Hyphomicrobiales bacterium]